MIIFQINGQTTGLNVLNEQALMNQMDNIIAEFVKETTLYLYGQIKQRVPVDHGRARSSLQIIQDNRYSYRIISGVNYLTEIDEGTGIYGIRHTKITPVYAKVLMFYVGNQVVFAKSTKGQPGKHFTEAGINATISEAGNILNDVLRNY